MHPAFTRIDHRPWALPTERWAWRQSWLDLLFMHWPVPAALLQPLVPEGLVVQEFEGSSWIGVVPFRMSGVMRRGLPDVPGVSRFPELNVRIYVEAEGKPGVWFLSLDATNPLAVWAARTFFHLPYFRANISLNALEQGFHFHSHRRGGAEQFEVRYQPKGDVFESSPGTLCHWLTERYCLYAQAPDGRLLRNEVHHEPWQLQLAEATLSQNTMLDSHGLNQSGSPLLHFASGIDVVVWNADEVTPR